MIQDSRIKFVFFGTPELSVEILEHLKENGFIPSLIVTNPDRPQGRKMILTPPPVKLWAQKNEIKFLQPEKLDSVFNLQLTTYNPQLFIVVAYGKILPKKVLEIPEKGALNIHYSLLPKYRGASPIESAILNDDKDTGVSIMLMDKKMDHGPIVAQQRLENHESGITNQEWPMKAAALRKIMNKTARALLIQTIPRFVAGDVTAKEQNHKEATYCGKFTKNDGLLDLTGDPYKNFLKIRAFDDSIGTYFISEKNNKKIRVVIKDAEFENCKLELIKVVPEGKKEMSYE